MKKSDLINKLARLEFQNDYLCAELGYVDNLLKKIGFPNGLESVKWAASEILEEEIGQQKNCDI